MNLTGQPLVDVGLAIAAILNNKKSIEELSGKELQETISLVLEATNHPKKDLGPLDKLKVLSSYWQNNPMIGLNLGKNDDNLKLYRNTLERALSSTGRTTKGVCQICGANNIFIDANRSWFPLGSSSNSDPCTLPGLGGKFLCACCFCALVLLPLGCGLIGSNPYLYHLTDPKLICETASEGVSKVRSLMVANSFGNSGLSIQSKLTGRLALLETIAGSLLWDRNSGGKLSKRSQNGATIISFNNSGTKVVWLQLHMPAQALDFFAEIDVAGLKETFMKWAMPCKDQYRKVGNTQEKAPNELFECLCDDLEQRRSIAPLLRTILVRRQPSKRILLREECKVLEIYEDIALGKEKRFQLLERIAKRINDMKQIYRDSFVRQLGNISKKETLLKLLKDFARKESTNLRLSFEEISVLDREKSNEIVSLLYLLCVAEEEKE